jgi:hypothetical protein
MAGKDLTHSDLVTAFEARFDYLSARTMAVELLGVAGISKQAAYAPPDLKALCAAIDARFGPGGARILEALSAGDAPAAAAAKAVQEKAPEPAPAAAEPDRAGPDRAGQDRAGQDKAGPEKAASAKADAKDAGDAADSDHKGPPMGDDKKPAGKK